MGSRKMVGQGRGERQSEVTAGGWLWALDAARGRDRLARERRGAEAPRTALRWLARARGGDLGVLPAARDGRDYGIAPREARGGSRRLGTREWIAN